MAKTAMKVKQQRKQKFSTREYNRCKICGRPHNETYMDCPYYEQMQYFGDARIQALITLYNTRDTCMVRQLLDLCRQSMLPEGIPQSRYPSDLPQVIPPFAVWWLGTAYDYWMMRGEEAYLQTLLPAFQQYNK